MNEEDLLQDLLVKEPNPMGKKYFSLIVGLFVFQTTIMFGNALIRYRIGRFPNYNMLPFTLLPTILTMGMLFVLFLLKKKAGWAFGAYLNISGVLAYIIDDLAQFVPFAKRYSYQYNFSGPLNQFLTFVHFIIIGSSIYFIFSKPIVNLFKISKRFKRNTMIVSIIISILAKFFTHYTIRNLTIHH